MSHFDIRDWADFVREVAPASARTVMEQHRTRCPDCSKLVDLLTRVVHVGQVEANCEPGPELVAAALAVFPGKPAGERSEWAGWPRLAARLIYDSDSDLVLAGARSTSATARQLMYRSGSYYVDLRLDGESESGVGTLIGQILDESTPETPVENSPVLMYSGREILARTLTNRFGEFSLDYEVKKDLRLCLPVAASGSRIELSLDRLAAER